MTWSRRRATVRAHRLVRRRRRLDERHVAQEFGVQYMRLLEQLRFFVRRTGLCQAAHQSKCVGSKNRDMEVVNEKRNEIVLNFFHKTRKFALFLYIGEHTFACDRLEVLKGSPFDSRSDDFT